MADRQKLGKYEIKRELGRGAMGVVYEAFDPSIERRVAIKTIRTDLYEDASLGAMLQRFEHEAKAAGKLNHPNIVTIHEFGRDGKNAYLVMEFVDGKPLSTLLQENAAFAPADAARIVGQVLEALEHAHRNGVIHRDIKPANILVLPDGNIKVTDFGIARLESSTLTQTGFRLGTPMCMSPEQFVGKEVDRRTDIFSAGVVLYELLTGERPFPGSSLTTIMHQVLKVEPPLPTELNVTLPRAFDEVISKAIAKRPSDRYSSAAEFAQALRLATEHPEAAGATALPRSPLPPDASSLGFQPLVDKTVAPTNRPPLDATVAMVRPNGVPPAAKKPPPPRYVAPAEPELAEEPPKRRRWLWFALLIPVVAAALLLGQYAPSGPPAPPVQNRSPAPLPPAQPATPPQTQPPQTPAPPVEPPMPPQAANAAEQSAPPQEHPPSAEPATDAMGLEFWDSVKESKDPRDFKEYLRKYPSGQFAGLAKIRLAELARRPAPAPKPAPPAPPEDKVAAQPEADTAQPGQAGQRVPVEVVRQRALAGYARAMNNPGVFYRDGRDVPQSDTEAVSWFRRAVEKGNEKAMTNLAVMYLRGRGVPRDQKEARALLERAAALGDERAEQMLGRGGYAGEGGRDSRPAR